jgi:hypothetical protein
MPPKGTSTESGGPPDPCAGHDPADNRRDFRELCSAAARPALTERNDHVSQMKSPSRFALPFATTDTSSCCAPTAFPTLSSSRGRVGARTSDTSYRSVARHTPAAASTRQNGFKSLLVRSVSPIRCGVLRCERARGGAPYRLDRHPSSPAWPGRRSGKSARLGLQRASETECSARWCSSS